MLKISRKKRNYFKYLDENFAIFLVKAEKYELPDDLGMYVIRQGSIAKEEGSVR